MQNEIKQIHYYDLFYTVIQFNSLYECFSISCNVSFRHKFSVIVDSALKTALLFYDIVMYLTGELISSKEDIVGTDPFLLEAAAHPHLFRLNVTHKN